MKFLLGIGICMTVILGSVAAYAAPVGNIATPAVLKEGLVYKDSDSQFAFIIGTESDITFDRKLKNRNDDSEMKFLGAKTGFLVADRFYLYTTLGAAEVEQEFNIGNNKVRWNSDTGLSWGIGGTWMIYETTDRDDFGEGIFRFGLDARYRDLDLDIDEIVLNDAAHDESSANVTGVDYDADEWQIAFAVAYQWKKINPYVGIKYSDITGNTKATISGTKYTTEIAGDDKVGVFCGLGISLTDYSVFNIEGRFIDEEALSVGGTLRF